MVAVFWHEAILWCYGAAVLANIVFLASFFFATRKGDYRSALGIWLGLLPSAVVAFGGHSPHILLGYLLVFSVLSAFSATTLTSSLFSLPLPSKGYGSVTCLSLSLSIGVLWLLGNQGLAATLWAAGVALPLLHMVYLVIKRRKAAQPSESLYLLALAILSLSLLLCVQTVAFGNSYLPTLALCFLGIYLLSTTLPMLIRQRLDVEDSERLHAEINHKTSLLSMKNHELASAITKIANLRDSYRSLVRVLCHDLSNPLTLILLLSDPQKADSKISKPIRKAAHLMRKLIEQVREQEALQSGTTKLSIRPFDLGKCLDEARFVFEKLAAEKGVSLVVTNDASDEVLGDPTSFLNVVLSNLISNALKFSESGSRIEVSARDALDHVVIEVKDHGIGIPDEILPQVFNGGRLISRKGTHGESGTGFGMSLVNSYVSSYGGSMEVASKTTGSERGTVFRVKMSRNSEQLENIS